MSKMIFLVYRRLPSNTEKFLKISKNLTPVAFSSTPSFTTEFKQDLNNSIEFKRDLNNSIYNNKEVTSYINNKGVT